MYMADGRIREGIFKRNKFIEKCKVDLNEL